VLHGASHIFSMKKGQHISTSDSSESSKVRLIRAIHIPKENRVWNRSAVVRCKVRSP
jgi:hypothetical protein